MSREPAREAKDRSSVSAGYIARIHREIDWAVAEMERREGYGHVICELKFGAVPGATGGGHVLSHSVEFKETGRIPAG